MNTKQLNTKETFAIVEAINLKINQNEGLIKRQVPRTLDYTQEIEELKLLKRKLFDILHENEEPEILSVQEVVSNVK